MNEVFAGRFKLNGGVYYEAGLISDAIDIITGIIFVREAPGEKIPAVYISACLSVELAAGLKSSLAEKGEIKFLDHPSDEADFSISAFKALISTSGSIAICHKTAPRNDSIFGAASVLVSENPEKYDTIDDFFAAVSSGKSCLVPDFMTMISGPSKTADIEKQIITGMHGPKKLFAVGIFADGSSGAH